MGARPEEAEAYPWAPEDLHRREVPRRFAIASKEVTRVQFARFLQDNPAFRADYSAREDLSPDLDGPATNVALPTALAYCPLARRPRRNRGITTVLRTRSTLGGVRPIILKQGYLARTGYPLADRVRMGTRRPCRYIRH